MTNYKYSVIIILAFLLLYSCVNPMKKNILTPLNTSQINKIISKDTSFATTYSIILNKLNLNITKEDSLIFNKLSYERVHKYLKKINNEYYNKYLNDSISDIWNYTFNNYNKGVDSIINYWNNYLQANSSDSLVILLNNGIQLEKFKNSSGKIKDIPKLSIKVIAKKQEIDSLTVLYSICKKDEKPTYIYFYNGKINYFRYNKKIKDSTIIKVFPYFPPKYINTILNDSLYTLKYYIYSLYSNGKNYAYKSLKNDIPSYILNLIDTNSIDRVNANIYRDSIIYELIDKNFKQQDIFINNIKNEIFKNLDSLSYILLSPINE